MGWLLWQLPGWLAPPLIVFSSAQALWLGWWLGLEGLDRLIR